MDTYTYVRNEGDLRAIANGLPPGQTL